MPSLAIKWTVVGVIKKNFNFFKKRLYSSRETLYSLYSSRETFWRPFDALKDMESFCLILSITTKQISMKMFQRKFLSLNASWLCFSALCDSLKRCQIAFCDLKQRKIHIHYVFLEQFCTHQFMELSVSLCALVLKIIQMW